VWLIFILTGGFVAVAQLKHLLLLLGFRTEQITYVFGMCLKKCHPQIFGDEPHLHIIYDIAKLLRF